MNWRRRGVPSQGAWRGLTMLRASVVVQNIHRLGTNEPEEEDAMLLTTQARIPWSRVYLSVLAAVLITAMIPIARNSEPQPARTPETWVSDLRILAGMIVERHPNPFEYGISREQFIGRAESLRRRIPSLTDWERSLGFVELVAALNEGHTRLGRLARVFDQKSIPLRLRPFADGWRVMGCPDPDLLGARVEEIGDLPVEQAVAIIKRYIPADNDFYRHEVAGEFLIYPAALEISGIAAAGHGGRLVVVDQAGRSRTLKFRSGERQDLQQLECRASEETTPPPGAHRNYWFRVLDRNMAYLRFDAFLDAEEESFDAFCSRLSAILKKEDARRLILDLRSNDGGDGRLMQTFLHMVIRNQRLQKPGSLVVLIGPKSFSAAVSLGVLLEQHAEPVFVGEPTGGRPNGHGNPSRFVLPGTGLMLQCSAVHVRLSDPSDRRPCLWPDITIRPSFEDCRAGADPVFAAATAQIELPSLDVLLALDDADESFDGQSAAAEYEKVRTPSRWSLRDFESDLLRLAQRSQRAGDAAGETALLKLAVRDFGYSAAPHSATGAALERAGDLDAALAAYGRALRRDRGDLDAAAGLTRIRGLLHQPLVPEILGTSSD
jgi:hypothetical protein